MLDADAGEEVSLSPPGTTAAATAARSAADQSASAVG
jgi:hypothetical protein